MNKQSGFIEIAALGGLVLMAVSATFAYLFIAQPHKMSGASMMPAIEDKEYFLTNKMDRDYKHGDIVIFRNPQDDSQDFIKRIVAMPGEKIMLKEGKLYVNGQAEQGSYQLTGQTNPGPFIAENEEKTVPQDEYFMLGDRRENSLDSRNYGFIKKEEIIGKYWFSYYK